jgi:hypothetical protein
MCEFENLVSNVLSESIFFFNFNVDGVIYTSLEVTS